MSELERLLNYLREQYSLEPSDLALPDQARGAIIGAHEIIGTIQDLLDNGYPQEEETQDD